MGSLFAISFAKLKLRMNQSLSSRGMLPTFHQHYVSLPQAMQWPGGRSKHIGQWRGCGNRMLRVSIYKDVAGPHQHAEHLSRLEEGLRHAGLPE
jgi:hypothetical protein